tara:strand:+ start:864 stop:1529 length:666 start_codon:yes stop_codon:yes gene_type:complete
MAKILIGCETSGIVREAFLKLGHDTWSCDLLPSDKPSNRHIVSDVRDVIKMGWDMLIVAHPPCTRLCNSGVRWLHKAPPNKTKEDMWQDLEEGCSLFSDLWNADIPFVAVENPVMHKYAKSRIKNYQHFSQSVQPWQFGTDENGSDNVKKRTCLWLRNLPNLEPTGTLDGTSARDECHKVAPSKDRWKIRSKFYEGIANAMANQWTKFMTDKPMGQLELNF